jgi:hypothetical protein
MEITKDEVQLIHSFCAELKLGILYYFTQFSGAVTRDKKIRTLEFENGLGQP